MSTVNTSARAFLLSSQALSTQSQSVANSYTSGRFADQVVWQEVSVAGSASGVETKVRLDATTSLPLSGTDSMGDLAIDGEGMLIIKKSGGTEDLYVKTGSFLVDKDGYLADFDNVLQGYNCDDKGNVIADKLVPIAIDKTAVSEAKATTDIKLKLKLNADTIASGEAGMLFREVTTPGVHALRGEGVVINRMIRSNISGGLPTTEQMVLQYGGFVETSKLDVTQATVSAIDKTKNAIEMTIVRGQDKQIIPVKVDIASSISYKDALKAIADEVNSSHSNILAAKILEDTTISQNAASLFIYSKNDNSQITFAVTSDLENVFKASGSVDLKIEGANVIQSADKELRRFATLEQFSNILTRDEFTVSFIGSGKKDTLFLKSADEEMINVKNQDSSADILTTFGVTNANQGTLEPLYSYLDPRYNLAGRKNSPDYQERVSIFDSKGGKKDLTFAFKKVSATSWVAEVFTTSGIDAASTLYRRDGLLQAGILNFSPDGAYINSDPILNVTIGKNFIANPAVDIGAPASSSMTIAGTTFNYNASPTASTDFASVIDLIYAINNNPACACTAELAPGSGGYAIALKAKNIGVDITITGTPGLLDYMGLSDALPTENVNIPLFGSDLMVDWATDTTPIAPTNAVINIDGKTSKELKRQHNFLDYTTDGSPFGEYESWYINQGDLYMQFKNGAPNKKLYAIPVALFKAPQGFRREGGAYAETDQSGKASIRLSGVYAGVVVSKALASSGSNPTEQLVKIIDIHQFSQMNAAAMSFQNQTLDGFLKRV